MTNFCQAGSIEFQSSMLILSQKLTDFDQPKKKLHNPLLNINLNIKEQIFQEILLHRWQEFDAGLKKPSCNGL